MRRRPAARVPCGWLLFLLAATGAPLPACRPQATPAPAPVQPLAGESWYSLRSGEQRYGAVHVAVARRDDGSTELRWTSTVRVELFGLPQEHGTETSVVLDRELRLVRFASEQTSASGRRSVRGETSAAGLVLRTVADDLVTETTLPATAIADLVVDAAFEAWIERSAWRDGEPPRRIQLLGSETGAVTEATVRRTQHDHTGSTWELQVQETSGLPPTVIQIDADGMVREQRTRVPPTHLVRCTQAEAAEFTHRRIPDRELLVFQPKQPLPPASQLLRATIEVTWLDIDPGEFELTDSRQRVVALRTDGNRHTAQLELSRAGEVTCRYSLRDGLDTAPADVRPSLVAALGDSDFVQPGDARIAAKARELVGDEPSALAAGRTLSTWVHAHIVPAMIAETLSGPEVLERRTGKCTEYSTLFGSLARAVGIPTRLVLGLRRFITAKGDSWGGHMWNEIYVGEWMPVDASVDEFGGSPSLLKFVHSESVRGTQALRWRLTESLELAVVAHEAIAKPPADPVRTTGLVGRTYSSAEHSFQFELATDVWRVTPTEQGQVTMLRLHPPAGAGASAQIHLVVFPVDGKQLPRGLLTARLQTHRAAMADLQVVDDTSTEVAGCGGHRLRFEGAVSGDPPKPRRVTEVMWFRDGKGFLCNLIGKPDAHDAQLANFDALLASFAFFGH